MQKISTIKQSVTVVKALSCSKSTMQDVSVVAKKSPLSPRTDRRGNDGLYNKYSGFS